jgi:hypothetical protein
MGEPGSQLGQLERLAFTPICRQYERVVSEKPLRTEDEPMAEGVQHATAFADRKTDQRTGPILTGGSPQYH